MNHKDNLDPMLDQALSEYSNAQPLSGMEDRILRRIAAQPESRARRWTWIFAPAAALALIVVALWLGLRAPARQPAVATNRIQAAQPAVTNAPQVETPHAPAARPQSMPLQSSSRRTVSSVKTHSSKAESAKAEPKPFPTPLPMTSEEHALLALARTHPDALLTSLDDGNNLSIPPIEIKPIAPEAGAPQGEQQ